VVPEEARKVGSSEIISSSRRFKHTDDRASRNKMGLRSGIEGTKGEGNVGGVNKRADF
jgi:hypothetical protein